MVSKRKMGIQTLVLVGVLAALVFALSRISIQIPLGVGDKTRIHFGNIMCLLSGVMFGPWVGGLSAGIGSMIFDLTDPLYISEFWITFITKFCMGFLAGLLARGPFAKLKPVPRAIGSALGGQVLYIVLYLIKSLLMQRFVMGNPWDAALVVVTGKLAVSSVNGLLAVVGCALLAPPLRAALDAAGLFKDKSRHSPA